MYHFGEFRLDPAARELWRGEEELALPRRGFDGLVFLIEHRDRALSRDELITALWGHADVADVQLAKLISQLRQVLGDDGHEQHAIRTVPGFGYRWVATVETAPAHNGVAREIMPPEAAPASWFRRGTVFILLVLLALSAVLVYRYGHFGHETTRLSREPGEAVAVLPLDIDLTDESADAGWMRLGVMDLIAERLRNAGLPVPSSDSVVSALHAAGGLSEVERHSALRETLGASILVQGTAASTGDGWVVELVATSDGDRRRIESQAGEIIPAAGRAVDLLLAALGRAAEPGHDDNAAVSEIVQRARAAFLNLELDTARSILAQAPEPLRDAPELRHELAWVEFRAGRLDLAEAFAETLLDDPAVAARPRLQAKVLTLRGIVAANRQENPVAGVPYYDAAVAVLDDQPWAPELGTALALRGSARTASHDFDTAARDLGRARALFQAAGDRLELARVYNYFGHLESQRKRPGEALPHYQAALEISDAFGHVDGLRANLFALLVAQMQLLTWPAALDTSQRLLALRERIQDPLRRHAIIAVHATVLAGLGRHREVDAILTGLQDIPDRPSMAVPQEQQVRARLAWQQGQPVRALQAAARVLELWPEDSVIQGLAEITLLHQRASIAAGRAVSGEDTLAALAVNLEDDPVYLVAQGEWAAWMGDHDVAERMFNQAVTRAESWAVPNALAAVADAYARWLLERGRVSEALALAGRIAGWAEYDYDSALLQVAVFHASGQHEVWATALQRAQELAGERELPAELLSPPE